LIPILDLMRQHLFCDYNIGASSAGGFYVYDVTNAATRFFVDDNGDISFYEATGTTPKFFWDASAESLGIGTSSPSYKLTINTPDEDHLRLENGSELGIIRVLDSGALDFWVHGDNSTDVMTFTTGSGVGTERMRIDSSGNVGIGTSTALTGPSAATALRIGNQINIYEYDDGSNPVQMNIDQNIDANENYITTDHAARYQMRDGVHKWFTTGSGTAGTATNIGAGEAMRIDSSGNVGIGTDSPSTKVEISGTGFQTLSVTSTNSSPVLKLNSAASSVAYLQWNNAGSSPLSFYDLTASSERMRIDSSGNVGIGVTPATTQTLTTQITNGLSLFGNNTTPYGFISNNHVWATGTGDKYLVSGYGASYYKQYSGVHSWATAPAGTANNPLTFTERMRIDSSGNLLVGTTSSNYASVGSQLGVGGSNYMTRSNAQPLLLNRLTSDGDIALFMKDGATVGSIGFVATGTYIQGETDHSGFRFGGNQIVPFRNGADTDDTTDLGASGVRFDDIYATNGTIQTSDRNEKQDIAELSDAEQRVAVAAKGLLRKFRWRDSVEAKGDEARTHFGIIAQDLQAAFAAEGLDAGDYAMFISSTWTDEETGEERTRMGVRYSELLAFIIAAI
jgi:hypothetical protein